MRKNTQEGDEAALTRREREIMDIVYAGEEVTARQIWEKLPGAPTYSTVRTLLGVLEEKGHLARRAEGKAFLYRPTRQRDEAAASALRRLLSTFFGGSIEKAVCGLLQMEESSLTDAELARIGRMIREAKKERNS